MEGRASSPIQAGGDARRSVCEVAIGCTFCRAQLGIVGAARVFSLQYNSKDILSPEYIYDPFSRSRSAHFR